MLTCGSGERRVPRDHGTGRIVLTPNLFGVALGLAGLAQCWELGRDAGLVPSTAVDLLWAVVAVVWLGLLAAYLRQARGGRLRADLTDPVVGPFVALALVVPMVLAVPLAAQTAQLGRALFVTALVSSCAFGGWITAQWMLGDFPLSRWHPGYFLPTVAGGLVSSAVAATLGHPWLAKVMFGYGTLCWLALGSIILARLFTRPPLPPALLPTMAIEVAPPVVAGNAWFAINGLQVDLLALMLAGYAALMAIVQVGLVPAYARLPFTAGWWAFSFSYAAAVAFAMRWLAATGHAQRGWAVVLLCLVTAGIGALTVRSLVAIRRGTFFARSAPPTG